jgi:3-phosphoglycerate kinase
MTPYVEESAAGLLLEEEIEGLGTIVETPQKPFVAVIGGAKVSDKVGIIQALLDKVQTICIGGAMAYTFLKAQGHKVGASRVEEDKLFVARKVLTGADARGVQILLPKDHVVADEFSETAKAQIVAGVEIQDGMMGLDIGPQTRKEYAEVVKGAASLLWNGPMGVFEWDAFANGTNAIAAAAAECKGYTVVGGGDSVAAIEKAGVSDKINHVSTGGGASLEFLEYGILPGLKVLEK